MRIVIKYVRRGFYALVSFFGGTAMWLLFKTWDRFGTLPPYTKMIGGMVWAALTGVDLDEEAFLGRVDAFFAKVRACCRLSRRGG